jgi:membrane protease YdiL (CAAX protease family)
MIKADEIRQPNRIKIGEPFFILLEIFSVLFPLYFGLRINGWTGISHIRFGGDLVLLGGPFAYLGLAGSVIMMALVRVIRKSEFSQIGLVRINKIGLTIIKGLGVALAVFGAVLFIINPLLNIIPGLEPRNMDRFTILRNNPAALVLNIGAMWVTAAFFEELVWRGFLIERLTTLFMSDKLISKIIVLLVSAAVFGLAHAYQGPAGMIKTGAIGLVFGAAYLLLGRDLWPLILAHGLIDTLDFISHFYGA